MATLAAQTVSRVGLEATYATAGASGDEFDNNGVEFVHIKNGTGGDITVTIETPATVDGLAVAERTVVVTLAEDRFIGPFPRSVYNDSAAKVQLTYSAINLTIALLKLSA